MRNGRLSRRHLQNPKLTRMFVCFLSLHSVNSLIQLTPSVQYRKRYSEYQEISQMRWFERVGLFSV